jgi:2-deoxy-D-gluconate 3-dehydrogenase
MNNSSTMTTPSITELFSLEGKTAVVTGGAMGIGLAVADRLHEAGASVVIADPSGDRVDAVAQLERRRPGCAAAIGCDVSEEASVAELIDFAETQFGGIDVFVNNAGIYPTCPLLEVEAKLFRRVIDVNLIGLFLCTQAAAKSMVGSGREGSIVNITSIDALHPSMVGLAHYDASKHGAWGFTKNAALELAEYGIRVNAIAPGGVATPGVGATDPDAISMFEQMIPMGRMGDADEIARVALFLASAMSSYMTGSQVVVDGGRLLR